MTELRTAVETDYADTNILPITKTAAGSGLFKATLAGLRTAILAGASLLPSLVGNGGKALFVKADESGVEWDTLTSTPATPDENVGFIDTNPPAAHRYWRVRSTDTGTDYISGLDFLDSTMTPFVSQNWGTNEGSRAQMQGGDPNNYVGFSPLVVACDFTTPQLIGGVSMTARNVYQSQSPANFYIEGSDDNAAWTTYTLVGPIPWYSGEKSFFELRPYMVRFTAPSTSEQDLNEMAFASSVGGANLAVAMTDPASNGRVMATPFYTGSPDLHLLFDGVTTGANNYYGGNNGLGIDYRFKDRPSLAELRLTTRQTYYGQGPSNFTLSSSRDGITYTQFYAGVPATWTDNQTQSFVLPALAPPSAGSGGGSGGTNTPLWAVETTATTGGTAQVLVLPKACVVTDVLVFENGLRQKTADYSISGTNLTYTPLTTGADLAVVGKFNT